MEAGHPVDGEAVVNVHVRHVHQVVFVQNGHLGIGILFLDPAVQFLDDGHQLGHRLLQVVQGPLFQGFRQDGMVGVGAGFGHGGNGLLHRQTPGGEQPDQLGNNHRGVGVVDLNDGVLMQRGEGPPLLLHLLQDELGSAADHEVLLVHPQQPASPVAVVGVEEQGQVVLDIRFVKVNALLHQALIHSGQVEQMQLVHAVVIAGDIQVIQYALHVPLGEGHGEPGARLLQPALGGEPGIGALHLLVVLKVLMEQAEVVQQAHTVPGQAQGGGGVQVAGGQAPQAPVAQRGLVLHLFHGGEVLAGLGQGLLHLIVDAQVDQVVGEQLAHQKLRGDIVQLFLPLDAGGGGQLLLGQLQKGLVNLLVVRSHQALGKPQAHFLLQLVTHPHGSYLLSSQPCPPFSQAWLSGSSRPSVQALPRGPCRAHSSRHGRKSRRAGPFSRPAPHPCPLGTCASASWCPPPWRGC